MQYQRKNSGDGEDDEYGDGEVQEKRGVYDHNRIYWDIDGNLRLGEISRNRDEEVLELLQLDNPDESDAEKLWMIIPSRWVRKWLLYAHLKSGEPEPGKIDMNTLLVKDEAFSPDKFEGASMVKGMRPKNTLKPPNPGLMENDSFPGHYRRVGIEVWKKLEGIYSFEGFPIAVRGAPYDDMTRWRVFKSTAHVKIDLLPPPILEKKDEKDKDKEESKSLMGGVSKMFGLGGGGAKKTPVKTQD